MNCYKFKKGFNIRKFIIFLSILLLVSYGVFNDRNLIIGPTIEIFSPTKDVETRENVLTIKGRVENMAFLSLNERPIFVDMEGIFEETLLLSPGSNIIEIKARDRFKQEALETVRVYYKESASSTEKII